MAKKHLGRFVAAGVVIGAIAAGISYFTKYKSFHKELEEDFHDFEDDLLDEEEETEEEADDASRNYVPLHRDGAEEAAEVGQETVEAAESYDKVTGTTVEEDTASSEDEIEQDSEERPVE